VSVVVVGTSHHTAPAEVRERFVFSRLEAETAMRRLVGAGADEAVLLSTCNRTEFYLASSTPEQAAARAVAALAGQAGLGPEDAAPHLYVHLRRDAVRHLFRVVTSLDSLILGEAQIHGQVKAAYGDATGMADPPLTGPVLSRLFQLALSVGGRVRSETTLGLGAASVPSAAVELARKIFGDLRGRRALVLGAGEMAELALACFAGEAMKELVVASRTEDRARLVAERVGGRAVAFSDVASILPAVDIVAAATSAPHTVLTLPLVEAARLEGRRGPLLVVAIAIPRDVDPAVGELSNVFLYGIDDLRQIVDENLSQRQAAIPAASLLVEAAVDDFSRWYAGRDVVPLIRALREGAESVRQAEVERLFRRLSHLSEDERQAVEGLTRQLLNKVLHAPTVRLRAAAAEREGLTLIEAARYLFDIGTAEGMESE
jgi:glutamyl-tRNA reductase